MIANNHGRKLSLVTCYLIGGLAVICIGISPNYISSLIAYFFVGFSYPYMTNCTMFLSEIGNDKYRTFSTMVILISWAVIEMIFVGLGYFIHEWR